MQWSRFFGIIFQGSATTRGGLWLIASERSRSHNQSHGSGQRQHATGSQVAAGNEVIADGLVWQSGESGRVAHSDAERFELSEDQPAECRGIHAPTIPHD